MKTQLKHTFITLGEGNTPLLKYKNNLYLKKEDKNPTGSYKDRDTVFIINKALKNNIKKLHVVSSGNAAISLAYYAKHVGINVCCYIPKNTSLHKKKLLYSLKVDLYEISGSYEDIYHEIAQKELDGWNVCPGINQYSGFGCKNIAYEIWKEMGVPDKIIVPCGNGTNLAFIFQGFVDLLKSKKINKLPQMIGVQVESANPISKAIEQGKNYVILENVPDSIAEGIVASESFSSKLAVNAINKSNGFMIDVNEVEIFSAYDECLKNELTCCEPTSTTVFAALNKLHNSKKETIVLIISGSNNKVV